MFDSVKRRPRRRVVKAVIAAAGAAAVGGAFFAVQANAASTPPANSLGAWRHEAQGATANIMVKVKPGTKCAEVRVWTSSGQGLVGRTALDYTKPYYNPAAWNSTAIVAPVGSHVDVYQWPVSCEVYYRGHPSPQVGYESSPYVVENQGSGDYWLDASQ